VKELGMGVEGQDAVYLDVTHIPADVLDRKLGGIMEIYEKFQGVDPRHEPMKIFPAVHYSMAGCGPTTRPTPTTTWSPAAPASRPPTSPASMRPESATTRTTEPTGWEPTLSCPASTPG